MTMSNVFMIAAVAGASALLTALLRRHAVRIGMVDVPGERSSHAVPTPRGGGLAIGIMSCAGAAWLHRQGLIGAGLFNAVLAGAPAVMLVGWIDDWRGLAPAVRGLAYLCIAGWTVLFFSGLSSIDLGTVRLHFGAAGLVVGTLALAWLINLYNFMDGTDALAGIEAVCACLYGGLLFALAGDAGAAWLCAVVAAACTGFLLFNWPPARIFMGDAGSCSTGFLLGVLALYGEQSGAVPILCWAILLSVFICDATLTLLRRIAAREKWYSPHRTHAYQLLVQAGLSHRGLALSVMAINLLVLGPLAVVAALYREFLLPAALVSLSGVSLGWLAVQRLRRVRPAPEASP